MTGSNRGKNRSSERGLQNVLSSSSSRYLETLRRSVLCKGHRFAASNGEKQKKNWKLWIRRRFFIWAWICSVADSRGGFKKQTSGWNSANRCHFLCLYCGHDITSVWNDVQKCNRTENGSDEVELSHRLLLAWQLHGIKTAKQNKKKNKPREKSN